MKKPIAAAVSCLMAGALMLLAPPVPAEVYKTVDAEGNVIYTDQPPDPDAKPMDLPGLSIIESLPMKPPAGPAAEAGEGEEEVTDIRELRRGYRDFKITSPTQDEYIEGTGNNVTISWDTRYALQPGMMVVISVDGKALPPTLASSVTLEQVDRGEHTVSAQLVDARNRKIASASPVTFYVRQFSQNFAQPPAPTPARR